jgi:hypothetical protein
MWHGGLLEDTGERIRNPSRRRAIVFRPTPAGLAYLEGSEAA